MFLSITFASKLTPTAKVIFAMSGVEKWDTKSVQYIATTVETAIIHSANEASIPRY